ncbi:MAG TPA: hypothetical protein VGH66_03580 [Acidimicrobiales bacterium]
MTRLDTSHGDAGEAIRSRAKRRVPLGDEAVLALQRVAGNAAMTGLLGGQSGGSNPTRGGGKSGNDKKTGPSGSKGKSAPWTSNELAALAKEGSEKIIRSLADRDTRNGVSALLKSGDLDRIISGLPKSSGLSPTTHAAMPAIIETKLLSFSQLAALFNKRFDRVLTKEQDAGLTYDALVMVWKQLDLLPTADVSETTTLAVINFIKGGGGMYMDKQPGQGAKVELGTASSQAVIEHTVRHEIGHGVHAQLAPVVDHWLQYDIGMWYGQVDDDGVDEFIEELGGYPATYNDPNGVNRPFTAADKKVVRQTIQSFTNAASWTPGAINLDPAGWRLAKLQAIPGLPETINESPAYWYNNYQQYHMAPNGKRLFFNHWYNRWYWMSDRAISLVNTTGEAYSAMSEYELFANAYAEYFKDPKGKTNPQLWGGGLSSEVKQFFSTNVVHRQPYDKLAKRDKKTNK